MRWLPSGSIACETGDQFCAQPNATHIAEHRSEAAAVGRHRGGPLRDGRPTSTERLKRHNQGPEEFVSVDQSRHIRARKEQDFHKTIIRAGAESAVLPRA